MIAAAGCLLVVLCAAGCRPAERVAWAADAHGVALLAGPGAALQPMAMIRRERAFAFYLSALLAENRGNLRAALQQYGIAHLQDPGSAQILLKRGILQLQLGDTSRAEESLQRASRRDPADPRPRFVLGVLYTQQQRFEEAARQYEQVLVRDPVNLGALSELAELYVLQERVQEGLGVYERLLQQKPNSPVLHFTLGVLYAKAARWPEAVLHMGRAVDLDSAYLEARLGLAVSLELAGQVERAREEFLQALKLEPANTQLIHYLARISQRLGDLEQTAQWLGRYLSFQPRDPDAHLELALVRIEQGRWQEAAATLQGVLERSPPGVETAQLWMVLGMAYESGRQLGAAEEAYGQAAVMAPEAVEPLLHLVIVFHRAGRWMEAERVCQRAFELEPDHPEVLNSFGFLYADWGVQLEEAVRLIDRALAQDPQNGAYLDSLGWAYFKLGRLEEARQVLEDAVRRMPDGEILDHLGQVYLNSGKIQEAEEAFRRGLTVEKKDRDIIDRLKAHLKALHSEKRKD